MKFSNRTVTAIAASMLALGATAQAQQHVVGSGDLDRDGITNRHDRDRDGDGIVNARDAQPDRPNVRQAGRRGPRGDLDRDGIRNREDPDRDGDGVRNRRDLDPKHPRRG